MEIKKSKNSHCRADNLKKRGKNVKEATKIIKQQAKTPKGSPKPMGRPREWTDEEIEAEANAKQITLNAEAQAKANKILADSLTPEFVHYQGILKWDGRLPTTNASNVMPFINIGKK